MLNKSIYAAILILTACRTPQGDYGIRDGDQAGTAFLERLVSAEEYHSLARQSGQESFIKFSHFFAVPAGEALHDRLYLQNTRRFEFHLPFLKTQTERYRNVDNYESLIYPSDNAEEPSAKEITAGAVYLQEGRAYPGFASGPVLGFEIYFRTEFRNGAARTKIDVQEVARFHRKLASAVSFLPATQIAYLIPGQADYFQFKRPLEQAGVPIIKGWDFHRFAEQPTTYHPATSYGVLRKFSVEDLAAGAYTAKDILVFNVVPLDVGPNAGIITSEPQVPHSHVIFRSVNLDVPDMYIPAADRQTAIVANLNKLVRFEAKADGTWTLLGEDQIPALRADAEAYWRSRERQPLEVPLDLSRDELFHWHEGAIPNPDLARSYGAKGTNYAILDKELRDKGIDRSDSHRSFLVPFTFFERHRQSKITLQNCAKAASKCEEEVGQACLAPKQRCDLLVSQEKDLAAYIAAVTEQDNLSTMSADAVKRKTELAFIRRLIRAIKINREDLARLKAAMAVFPAGTRMRLRSSTNAEDIAGLTGAGLYESKSACLGDDDDTDAGSACRSEFELERIRARIAKLREMDEVAHADLIADLTKQLTKTYPLDGAVKEVFSTLWTDRAFLSREFYRIDHRRVYMGILVHPSYVEEAANGVAVATFRADGTMELNAVSQIDDISVTNPEFPGAVAEQVTGILAVDGSFGNTTYVGRSNLVTEGVTVLSATELAELARQIHIVGTKLRSIYPRDRIGDRLDLEFKLDRQRKVTIKQARPL